MKMNSTSTPYAKENDGKITLICLKALEIMRRPFGLGGFLLRFLAVVAGIVITAMISPTALRIATGLVFLFAVLAVIGALIRDKRRREDPAWE